MSTKMTEYTYAPEGALLTGEENVYYTSELSRLEKAMEAGAILEGVATRCDCATMDLTVEFGAFRGIIPRDEVQYSRDGEDVRDIAIITRVGKPTAFKVKEISPIPGAAPRIILSRRAAQEECEKSFVSRLVPGDVIPATVTHLEQFGAFVDIGCGIVSLLTVDAISVSRISHPRERFRCGDRILCAVRSVDRETGRIYMTHRELLGTWEENAAEFSPSQTVTGVVRSIEDYGIFVELTPNLAGLAEYKDGVEVGDVCAVFVKSIIPEKMKIKLVLIDSSQGGVGRPIEYSPEIRKTRHISSWRYSPACSSKVIETVFDEEH